MKFKLLAILALGSGLAAVGVGPLHAQSPSRDAGERLSPLDSNPACMERNGPSCVTTETPVRRNAIVPAAPPVTVIRAPDTATRLPSDVIVTPPPGAGPTTTPNLPPADQTGDFSVGRTRSPSNSGTSGSVTTIPAAPVSSSPAGSSAAGSPGTAPSGSGGGTSSKGGIGR